MAIYDVTDTAFAGGAKGDYDFSTNTGTDDTAAFAAAINAAKAAGGGTVYIPSGGKYLLSSRFDATNFPNQILPTLDVAGVRIIGDPVGRGGSNLVIGADYDLFRLGVGTVAAGGGWTGSGYVEGLEISGIAPFSCSR